MNRPESPDPSNGRGEHEVVDAQGRPVTTGAAPSGGAGWGRGGWGSHSGRDMWNWGWSWPPRAGRRRSVPWVGIFLVVLGGLLLFEQVLPGVRVAGSAFLLALGLAFLISWVIERGPGTLYAGAILTALGLSNVLSDTGIISGPGWGTLFIGIAFGFIALVRATSGGGLGWQLWFGLILVAVGASSIAERQITGFPDLGRLVWPVILVALGLWLVLRARGRRAYG